MKRKTKNQIIAERIALLLNWGKADSDDCFIVKLSRSEWERIIVALETCNISVRDFARKSRKNKNAKIGARFIGAWR